MTTVTINKVYYIDLEAFIREEYGQEYEFVADMECGNDSAHRFSIKKKSLDGYDIKRLELFKSGKYVGFMAWTLLEDLANRDRIPEGEYLIEVSW